VPKIDHNKLIEIEANLNEFGKQLYPDKKDRIEQSSDVEMIDQESDIRSSLKSQRNLTVKFTEHKEPALTVWKCPNCSMLNILGENITCKNEKNCTFDVRDGDADPEFSEIT
jgi:hypothetical protein